MTFLSLFRFVQKVIEDAYIHTYIYISVVFFPPWINWFQSLLTKQRNKREREKKYLHHHVNLFVAWMHIYRKKERKKWLCSSFIHRPNSAGANIRCTCWFSVSHLLVVVICVRNRVHFFSLFIFRWRRRRRKKGYLISSRFDESTSFSSTKSWSE